MHFSFSAARLALGITFLISTLASAEYTLSSEDVYQGSNFFEKFEFLTDEDPTAGFVDYQNQNAASSNIFGGQLIWNTSDQAYLGVDHWNKIRTDGSVRGRPSVRLESKKTYQYGLFVLDLAHMPANVCGTWPAFWTTSFVDYPKWGEIDILENVHEQNFSLATLHTAAGCTVVGNQISNQMTGNENSYNCDDRATKSPYGAQSANQGCSAVNNIPNTYGADMNKVGGGVYAMEWTPDVIRVWSFERKNIPRDITAGNPQPSNWIKPVFTTAQGSCNIGTHFKNHHVILDTTFCGNWAGLDYFWQQTSCYNNNIDSNGNHVYPSCSQYVAANPNTFAEAYWLINSLKVYQQSNVTKDLISNAIREEFVSPTSKRASIRTTSDNFQRFAKISPDSTAVTGLDRPLYSNHTIVANSTILATPSANVVEMSSTTASAPIGTVDVTSYVPETYTFCSDDLGVSSCTIETITAKHTIKIYPVYHLSSINHAPKPPSATITKDGSGHGVNTVIVLSIKMEIQQSATASPTALVASLTLPDIPATTTPAGEVPGSIFTNMPEITTISLAYLDEPITTIITDTIGTSERVFTVVLDPILPNPSATPFPASSYGDNGGDVLSTTYITSVSGTMTTVFTLTVKPNPATLVSGSYVEGRMYTTEITSIDGSVTDVFSITVAPRPVVSGSYVGSKGYITAEGSSSLESGSMSTALSKQSVINTGTTSETNIRPTATGYIFPSSHKSASASSSNGSFCLLAFVVGMVAIMLL